MKLNNIDLNKLNVFFHVMDTGGYAGASKELNVTKSAVSQSITGLEAQLGVQLFLRKSKKLIPTAEAEEVYKEFSVYQTNLKRTLSLLSNDTDKVTGLVKVGAYLEFAKKELSPFLKSFVEKYAEVQIKLKFESPTRLQELLESNQLDLAFSIYPVKNIKGVTSEKVLKEELVMVCRRGHAQKYKKFEHFETAHFIAYYKDQEVLKKWARVHFKKRIKTFNVPVFAATAEMVVASVKEGIGIGVVPDYLVDQDLEVIRPTVKKLEDYIWLNYYKGQFANSAHKAFLEEISKKLSAV